MKATSRKKTTQLSFHGFIEVKKLYCFVKPIYSEVLVPAEKLKDINKEIRDQRLEDT